MDDNLFEFKYNLYKNMIFKICYSYLSNIHDTEEAVQDTFLKYYKKDLKFPSDEDEKKYLIRIAINSSLDILRKRKPVLEHCDIEGKNDTCYEVTSILKMVEKLKPKYKEVIILKYVKNYGNREIAKILNISEATLRKRQQRALETLKKLEGGNKNE